MIIEPKIRELTRAFEAMIKTNEECPYHNMLDMYITELNEESSFSYAYFRHLIQWLLCTDATTSLMDTALGMAANP